MPLIDDFDNMSGVEKITYSHPLEVYLFEEAERFENFDVARELYCALCDNIWFYCGEEYFKDEFRIYSCSWRYAANLVVNIRENGEDYLDFYGRIGEGVSEGDVTQRIINIMRYIDWELKL